MSTYFQYNDPIISERRKGDTSDPYHPITQSIVIENNKVLLAEIPNKFDRVTVTGASVTWSEIDNGTLTENQYKVNYILGEIEFHSSRNSLTLQFDYMGTGAYYFPVERIWTLSDGTKVTQTLKDLLDSRLDITWKGTYSSTTTYQTNDAVSYNGNAYICLQTSTGNVPTNTTYWDLMASKGDQGIQGEQGIQGIQGIQGEKGVNNQGAWSNTLSYVVDDLVQYQGSTYICIQNSLGNPVTDNIYWRVFAEKGNSGIHTGPTPPSDDSMLWVKTDW
jgi:chitodextrinase